MFGVVAATAFGGLTTPAEAVQCAPPRCVVAGGGFSIGPKASAAANGTGYALHGSSVSYAGPAGSGSVALPGTAEDITAGADGAAYVTVPRARTVARIAPNGASNMFLVAYRPHRITAGPSRVVWFTMQAGGSAVNLVRMSSSGSLSFFQLPIPALDLQPSGPNGLALSDGSRRINFTAFLGAQPIRTRQMGVSKYTNSGYIRLQCPKDDYLFCAGQVTIRHGGRVVGTGAFSLRVNDAPATQIDVNGYGMSLIRTRSVPVTAHIVQHDPGGATRVTSARYTMFLRTSYSGPGK